MQKLFHLFFLISFIITTLSFEQESQNVYHITDDNFNLLLEKHSYIFVKFYAPWCGHCKSLAPEFSKAAETLQSQGSEIVFGSVDATVEQQLNSKFQLRGFPTLKFFMKGNPVNYEAGRTAEDILNWLEKKMGETSQDFSKKEELEEAKRKNKVVVAYFGEQGENFEKFNQISKHFDDVVFMYTFNQNLKKKYEFEGSMILFKQFDELQNKYPSQSLDIMDAVSFIGKYKVPTILELETSTNIIFGEQKPCLILFMDEEHTKEYNELKKASETLKGKILMATSDIKQSMGERISKDIGIKQQQLPKVYIVQATQKLIKYELEFEITAQNLILFYEQFLQGNLIPTVKSEPLPENNNGPVKKLVGKNFEQIVNDPKKDVLVKFYAPWCGHCKQSTFKQYNYFKKVAPYFIEAAEKLSNNFNIILAEYDATENENEGVSVQSYPTIKLYKANNKKKPIDFDNPRTVEGFIQFLKENASVEWLEENEVLVQDNDDEEYEDL